MTDWRIDIEDVRTMWTNDDIRRSMGILLAHPELNKSVEQNKCSSECARSRLYVGYMQCILKARFDLDFMFGVMCALGRAPIAICDIRPFFSEAEPWQNLF